MNIINNELVKDWLDKFDGESEVGLLTSIVNSEISIPEMIDSIHAHHLGEVEIAKDFYKRMWRSQYEDDAKEDYRETDGTTEEEV